MPTEDQPKSLSELLDRIEKVAEEKDKPSIKDIMEAVGRRSFGPLLLLVGVVSAAPGVGDIPGVATILGLFVLLVSVQLLFGRQEFWLPSWMLNRKIKHEKLKNTVGSMWMRRPARWIDGIATERLKLLIGPTAVYYVAGGCTFLGSLLPFTELVPFSTTAVSLGLVSFGISLIARDGLMTLIGYLITIVTALFVVVGIF